MRFLVPQSRNDKDSASRLARQLRLSGAVTAAVACAALASPAAALAGVCTSARVLGAIGKGLSAGPQVAVDGRGDGAVVWVAPDGRLRAVQVLRGRLIGSARALGRRDGARQLVAAAGGSGRGTTVTWITDGEIPRVMAATVDSQGRWREVSRLSAVDVGGRAPIVRGLSLAATGGVARVAWAQEETAVATRRVVLRTRVAAGSWDQPRTAVVVTDRPTLLGQTAVATGAGGQAVVVWRLIDQVRGANEVWSAHVAGDTVTPPTLVRSTPSFLQNLALSGDPSRVVASWLEVGSAAPGQAVMASGLGADGWGAATELARGAVFGPTMSTGTSARPLIGWVDAALSPRYAFTRAFLDSAGGGVVGAGRSPVVGVEPGAVAVRGPFSASVWRSRVGAQRASWVRTAQRGRVVLKRLDAVELPDVDAPATSVVAIDGRGRVVVGLVAGRRTGPSPVLLGATCS